LAVLGKALADPEWRVRAAVVGALARVGGGLAQPLLRRVAQDPHEHGNIRRAAARALGGGRHA
jgi:HEAT repeat protein